MDEAQEQALVAQPLVCRVAEHPVELRAHRERYRLLAGGEEIRDDGQVLGERAVLRRLVRAPLLGCRGDDARTRAEPSRRRAGGEPRGQRDQRDRRLVEEEELEREAGGGGDHARDETSERACEHRDEDADRGEDGGLVPVARAARRPLRRFRAQGGSRPRHARAAGRGARRARIAHCWRSLGTPPLPRLFDATGSRPSGTTLAGVRSKAIVGRGNRWQ
jgi:hypothetical protein